MNAALNSIGPFLRGILSINLVSTTAAPALARSAASRLLPPPIAVVLSIVFALLLRGRPAATVGGAILAASPGGRATEAVALLLAAAAAGGALRSVRSLKSWLEKSKGASTCESTPGSPCVKLTPPLATKAERDAAAQDRIDAAAKKRAAADAIRAEMETASKKAAADAAKAKEEAAAKKKAAADAAKAEKDAAAKKQAVADAIKAEEYAAAKKKAAADAAKAEKDAAAKKKAEDDAIKEAEAKLKAAMPYPFQYADPMKLQPAIEAAKKAGVARVAIEAAEVKLNEALNKAKAPPGTTMTAAGLLENDAGRDQLVKNRFNQADDDNSGSLDTDEVIGLIRTL